MRKLLTASIIMTLAVGLVAASFGPMLIQQVFATGGQCSSCAKLFSPGQLTSGLSGTGAHGVAKVFAPGQEAQVSGGSASDFAPGHLKP